MKKKMSRQSLAHCAVLPCDWNEEKDNALLKIYVYYYTLQSVLNDTIVNIPPL